MERTGSPVAARVLGDWQQLLAAGAFVKVMPHDYKRVLRERAERPQPADADPAADADSLAALAAANGRVDVAAAASPRPLEPAGEAGGS